MSHQTEGDAVDGSLVLDDHVEAELVVHDGAQAHDANVDVVSRVAHLQLCRVPKHLRHPRAFEVERRRLGRVRRLDGAALLGHRRRRREERVADDGVVERGALLVAKSPDDARRTLDHRRHHHGQTTRQVLDKNIEATMFRAEKLLNPLDVVGPERDFQISKDLR